jgi:serine/threonine-protein kinase
MTSTHHGTLLAGRYELGELIGRGGMGEVYAARDVRLERIVAVKRLRADLIDRPKMRDRVAAEARAAASLSHPHVVAVFDSVIEDGHACIVMERLDGRTLADDLGHGPLEPVRAVDAAVQILEGLAAAHEVGLVHRDVKPGNVLLADDGAWKVADFGIAKWADAETTLTATGELLGTPSYLAPERLEGLDASPRSDIYSVGVVLYEALAGRRPFDGDDPLQVALAVRDGAHQPLAEAEPELDPELCAVVERAMEPDPEDRFASAAEMASALREVVDEPGREPDGEPDSEQDATVPLRPPDPTLPLPVADATRPIPRMPALDHPADHGADTGPPTHGPVVDRPAFDLGRVVGRWTARFRGRHAAIAIAIAAAIVVAALVLTVVVAPRIGTAPTDAPAPAARSGAAARTDLDRALDRLERAVRP